VRIVNASRGWYERGLAGQAPIARKAETQRLG
jgi:hypothetical protein